MADRHLNKEFKLNINDNIDVKYGSVNKDNPQVIYVSGKCWVKTFSIYNDNRTIMDDIKAKMEKSIKYNLMDGVLFDDRKLIMDFDINTDAIIIGKKKYLSFEFFLKQCDDNIRDLNSLKSHMENKLKTVVNDLYYNLYENGFEVTKNKKE